MNKKCLVCGKLFEKPNNCSLRSWIKRKYCSRECGISKTSFIEGRTSWNKGLKGIIGPNKTSFKKGQVPRNKGKEHTSISGDKHPKWIKDRTLVKQYWTERNNPEYKNWRRKVLKRDNYKCKICGKEYAKKDKLIVHHILPWKDFPEERYNINNGITLCQKHHPRKRKEEQMLMLTFKELVEAI